MGTGSETGRSYRSKGGGRRMSATPKDTSNPVADQAGAIPVGTQQEQSEKLGRQKVLGENLRSIFNNIADEAVPSAMLKLLDELESKDGRK
jgi:Anti-sigma factor NepR